MFNVILLFAAKCRCYVDQRNAILYNAILFYETSLNYDKISLLS